METNSSQTIPQVTLRYHRSAVLDFEIRDSVAAANAIRHAFSPDTIDYCESFVAIYIDGSGRPIGWHQISSGGMTFVAVDIRVIMSAALVAGATRIIVAHNHPAGTLKPSDDDKRMTEKIKAACEILDIALLDHLIITRESYFSFSDNQIIL